MPGNWILVMVTSAARAICNIVGDGDNAILSVVDSTTIKTITVIVYKNKDKWYDTLSSPYCNEISFKLLQDLAALILGRLHQISLYTIDSIANARVYIYDDDLKHFFPRDYAYPKNQIQNYARYYPMI